MQKLAPAETSRTREDLLRTFLLVRKSTERICSPLTHEDFLLSVTEDTSPPKWHLAHTTWFFEHFILEKHMPGHRPFSSDYNFLFNSYYKRLGSYLPKSKRGAISRPGIEEVFLYRNHVTEELYSLIQGCTEVEFNEFKAVLELGINHEEQHQELLLMDIKRNFFENPTRPKYYNFTARRPNYVGRGQTWHNLPSGPVKVGVDKHTSDFAFDNEKDSHTQWIESCMISSHLVTNEEYLEFIDAGGYENPLFWLSDGWEWKEREKCSSPLYWVKEGPEWWNFTLHGMEALDPAAPVSHLSYYEAQAFAHWKGCRLPTEFEWEAVALTEKGGGPFMDDGVYEARATNDEFEKFSQIHGSLWEWTQSAYLPYPRYEKFGKGLSEYNEKFMCNQFVLRGGCAATPKRHYRPTYRNFYYPHMRWQFSGLRLAKDLA